VTSPPANLFDPVPPGLPDEHVDELAAGPCVRIERIVSCGHASPPGFWYDQNRPEFVALLQGSATLDFADGRSLPLRAGDHLTIAAHERHRVAWTSSDPQAVWLAVHYPG
jgi:cupin 2 domain-containing protein